MILTFLFAFYSLYSITTTWGTLLIYRIFCPANMWHKHVSFWTSICETSLHEIIMVRLELFVFSIPHDSIHFSLRWAWQGCFTAVAFRKLSLRVVPAARRQWWIFLSIPYREMAYWRVGGGYKLLISEKYQPCYFSNTIMYMGNSLVKASCLWIIVAEQIRAWCLWNDVCSVGFFLFFFVLKCYMVMMNPQKRGVCVVMN